MACLPANLKVKLGHISINVKHFKAARCSNKSCREWSREGGGRNVAFPSRLIENQCQCTLPRIIYAPGFTVLACNADKQLFVHYLLVKPSILAHSTP